MFRHWPGESNPPQYNFTGTVLGICAGAPLTRYSSEVLHVCSGSGRLERPACTKCCRYAVDLGVRKSANNISVSAIVPVMMLGLRKHKLFESQKAFSEKVARFKRSNSVRVEGGSTLSIRKGPGQAAAVCYGEVVAGHGTRVCQQKQRALCLSGWKTNTLAQLTPPKVDPIVQV